MNNSTLSIIINSMAEYFFQMNHDSLNDHELSHLYKSINYENIPDRYFSDYPRFYPYIEWERLNKMQSVRVAIRNEKLLEKIDLKRFDYKIKEIFFLVQRKPELLFTHFNFDFDNLSHDDAYFLACIGVDEYLNMVDLEKYNFNFIETMNIIKSHNFRRDVIFSLNCDNLKSYQVAEIIINTGEDCLHLFDLDSLTTLDWLELLPYQPDMLDHCDFDKFKRGDPFNLIQLVVMFDEPDLSYLIFEIDKKKITAFGWEKLLISNPNKYIDICDFHKIKENNWTVISHYHPHLLVHKL